MERMQICVTMDLKGQIFKVYATTWQKDTSSSSFERVRQALNTWIMSPASLCHSGHKGKRRGGHWFLRIDMRDHLSNADISHLYNRLLIQLSSNPSLYQGLLQPLLQLLQCHLQMPGGVQPRLLQFQELWQAGYKMSTNAIKFILNEGTKELWLWYIIHSWRWQKV